MLKPDFVLKLIMGDSDEAEVDDKKGAPGFLYTIFFVVGIMFALGIIIFIASVMMKSRFK